MALARGVGVGVDSTEIGVWLGIGRLNGATIGPAVGVGDGRLDGGRLKDIGGVVCGAALFDCATATTGSAAAASQTLARRKTLNPIIPVTLIAA